MIPVFYEALDRVNAELVGMLPTAVIDARASNVQKGQEVRIPVTPISTNEDVTASSSAPSGDGETIKTVSVTIDKIRRGTPILWTGEDELGVSGTGTLNAIQVDQFAQRIRSLRNEMEEDLCAEAYAGAMAKGNIRGTVGTNPFASDLSALTMVLKDLEDAGAPTSELQAVLNTEAGMYLRNLTQLQKINEAGETSLLRKGALGELFGFTIRESNGMKHKAGTPATKFQTNSATLAIGDTVIPVDTGSGTINAHDVIKFADDDNYYVVAESITTGDTTLKLTTPLKTAVGNDKAITIQSSVKPNALFARGSIILASRVPYVPSRGDIAIDRQIITDPLTGIPYELAVWGGAYQNSVTIATAWGCKNIKPENTVALLG